MESMESEKGLELQGGQEGETERGRERHFFILIPSLAAIWKEVSYHHFHPPILEVSLPSGVVRCRPTGSCTLGSCRRWGGCVVPTLPVPFC